jgi:hypothetical protein
MWLALGGDASLVVGVVTVRVVTYIVRLYRGIEGMQEGYRDTYSNRRIF